MRRTILQPDDIERKQLIDILSSWKIELEKLEDQYQRQTKDEKEKYLDCWKIANKQMIENLKSDKFSLSCFLMHSDDGTVEAIAFCEQSINKFDCSEPSPYFIYDYLAAPWNVQEELFPSSVNLKNKIPDMDYKLINFILMHCKEKEGACSKVIYDPDFRYFEVFSDLFMTKLQFDHSYRNWDGFGVFYINGYELSQEKLRNRCLDKEFEVSTPILNGAHNVEVFDNFPDNIVPVCAKKPAESEQLIDAAKTQLIDNVGKYCSTQSTWWYNHTKRATSFLNAVKETNNNDEFIKLVTSQHTLFHNNEPSNSNDSKTPEHNRPVKNQDLKDGFYEAVETCYKQIPH